MADGTSAAKEKRAGNATPVKRRGRPFEVGNSFGGRPKGVPNKVTQDIRQLARQLVEQPEAQARLAAGMRDGTLPVPIQIELLRHAYGVPKQSVAVEMNYATASTESLVERVRALLGDELLV
jgi:hypothetical protein